MDFVDIIRDSCSRQYERYRSYRQSKDTAATTVVGSVAGKVDKDTEPVENKPTPPSPRPTGGSSPGRLEAKVLPVLGRVPSIPKSRGPDFDMVDVGSPLPPPPKTHAPVSTPKVVINAAIIPTPHLDVSVQRFPLPGSTVSEEASERTPKRSPVAAPWTSTASQADPVTCGSYEQRPYASPAQSDQDKEKPKRMDFMRVFRPGANDSPPLPSSPSLSSTKCRSEISNPQPHPNPSYRPEISSVAAHRTRSPDPFSSSSELGSSFFSERHAAEMQRTFSSSQFSPDTLSAGTSESWKSEEARRRQKRQGVEGVDSAQARTT